MEDIEKNEAQNELVFDLDAFKKAASCKRPDLPDIKDTKTKNE